MIPNPILKVLSSMREHHVQCLLMGGQACVFYGAAEFSRDTDLAILADDQIDFWFRELRTPGLLMDSARAWPEAAKTASKIRPLIALAISNDEPALAAALAEEEQSERLKDKEYWLPLKRELEKMRIRR